MKAIRLTDREGERRAGRVGHVVISDETRHGNAGLRRYFWLLEHGAQMVYEPFGWKEEWKIDIVEFAHDAPGRITVRDLMVDLVVEGMGPTYRMLDLDELAAAISARTATAEDAALALTTAQAFLESFLHRRAEFPPPEIRRWYSADHRYPPLPCGTG